MKKKSIGTTPQARSLAYLRKDGYLCDTVEKWKRFPDRNKRLCPACHAGALIQVRVDLWNFADILAIHPLRKEIWLIQVTTASNAAARETKMRNHPEASKAILGALLGGVRVGVHSWAKRGSEGSRKLWTVVIREMHTEDLPVQAHAALAAEGVGDTGAVVDAEFFPEEDFELTPTGD